VANGRFRRRTCVAGIPRWTKGVSVLFFRRLGRSLTSYSLLVCLLSACAKTESHSTATVDDFGDTLRVSSPPQRIVSLNPTTTELVFALGAGKRLVGRTSYDSWPDSAKLVPDLGAGLRPNVEAILGAHPDLVLLYASQDNRPAAARLRAAGIRTLSLKIDSIGSFKSGIMLIGKVLGDTMRAKTVRDSVTASLDRVAAATRSLPRPKVFWHIWDAPIITIGKGSFMDELVRIAGGSNAYGDVASPSPVVSIEDISRRNPDFILAGPIGAKQIRTDEKWRLVRAVRADDVLVVDTTLVARPSVRLGEAAVALAKLLHPGSVR
jgi:iron complex transport system substrate-binding protein